MDSRLVSNGEARDGARPKGVDKLPSYGMDIDVDPGDGLETKAQSGGPQRVDNNREVVGTHQPQEVIKLQTC